MKMKRKKIHQSINTNTILVHIKYVWILSWAYRTSFRCFGFRFCPLILFVSSLACDRRYSSQVLAIYIDGSWREPIHDYWILYCMDCVHWLILYWYLNRRWCTSQHGPYERQPKTWSKMETKMNLNDHHECILYFFLFWLVSNRSIGVWPLLFPPILLCLYLFSVVHCLATETEHAFSWELSVSLSVLHLHW